MKNVRQILKNCSLRQFNSILFIMVLVIPCFLTCSDQKTDNRLATFNKLQKIKPYLKYLMESTRTPSISIGVAQKGRIIWEESFGWADREQKIKATSRTVYSLASISKPMTATAVMLLVKRGLVDLNKPVNSYLGKFKLRDFQGDNQDATVLRLLHHTAGLPTIWSFYFDGAKIGRPHITQSIKQYGILTSPPGMGYEYSNLGYGIAEYIIERVSGKSFSEFMRSEVFEPLGMKNSFVMTGKSQYESVAARYLENKNISPFFDNMSHGGGGVCASVHDLLLFGMFHLKNHLPDQKQILSDSTIDFMQSSVDSKVPNSPYKMGWDIKEIQGYRVVNHGGGMPGVSSALLLVPSENLVITILSNGTYIDLYRIARRMISLILPKKKVGKESGVNKEFPGQKNVQFPSRVFTGQWKGEINTGNNRIPVRLGVDEAGHVTLTRLDEGITYQPIETFRYNHGILCGSFDFFIPTQEASVCRHKVYLSLKLSGNRLFGFAAAVSYRVEVFFLPHYLELKRE